MSRDKVAEYGDRGDGIEMQVSEVTDEEAQLLHDDDDSEEFELDDTSDPVPRQQPQLQRQPSSRGFWSRHRPPRWLAFLYGPDPPRIYTINPVFPSIQALPRKWLEKTLPRQWQRVTLLVLFLIAWATSLAIPLILSKGTATDASGVAIRHVDCVDTLWKRNNECGLDGVNCRPFSNTSFAFRCPADCASVRVLNPHHVGSQDVNFRPLVIGGGGNSPYRGDSFLCGAAIHAGVIGDATGGCGVATLIGEYYQYFSSSQHNIESIPFDTYFPLSFTVTADPTIKCTTPDPRWTISLPLSILFTVLLAIFTTSPALYFFTTFLGTFTHVALVSDPPNLSTPSTTYLLPALISHYAGRLLPALFTAAIIYLTSVRHTLCPPTSSPPKSSPPHHPLETTLLHLLPLWLGALTNRTLEPLIPITRLTPSDLTAQPGAIPALITILLLLLTLTAIQAHTLHRAGRLPRYLAFYLAIAVGLGGLVMLPGLRVRLHHYVLALVLLPGTGTRTRVGMVCQGVLVGVFVNGVARWGFDSVVQTEGMLRGDGGFGGGVLPEVLPVVVEGLAGGLGDAGMRIWFKWRGLGEGLAKGGVEGMGVEGISVLVNDVERYRGWFAERPLEEQVFKWTREAGRVVDEYVRFGFVTEGGRALDYTEAGTWFANGSWSQGAGYW